MTRDPVHSRERIAAIEHQCFAFFVPTPVRLLPLPALEGGDGAEAIEVVTDAVEVFGVGAFEPEPDALAWSDLQLDLFQGKRGRLGAGRACYYRGRYFKGVGRTPLCQNLLEGSHHTGHMAPFSALREYLVSKAICGLGKSAAIVPTTDVMFAELPGSLSTLRHEPARVANEAYRAVVCRPFDFIRPSNLNQLLVTLPFESGAGRPTLGDGIRVMLQILERVLAGPLRVVDSPQGPSVDTRAQERRDGLLPAVLDRFFEDRWTKLELLLAAGVHCGSVANNFTVDGRFLDLELAAVTGAPQMTVMLWFDQDVMELESSKVRCEASVVRSHLGRWLSFVDGWFATTESVRIPAGLRERVRALRADLAAATARSWVGNDERYLDLMRAFVARYEDEPTSAAFRNAVVEHSIGLECRTLRLRAPRLSQVPHLSGGRAYWPFGAGSHTRMHRYEALEAGLIACARQTDLDALRTQAALAVGTLVDPAGPGNQ